MGSYSKHPCLGAKNGSFNKGYMGFPRAIGFPTENDHFGLFWGNTHIDNTPWKMFYMEHHGT